MSTRDTGVVADLERHIASRYKSKSEAAAALGCSQQYLCNVLAGRRSIPNWLRMLVGSKPISSRGRVRRHAPRANLSDAAKAVWQELLETGARSDGVRFVMPDGSSGELLNNGQVIWNDDSGKPFR